MWNDETTVIHHIERFAFRGVMDGWFCIHWDCLFFTWCRRWSDGLIFFIRMDDLGWH